ncbi:MAG: hypothetical protein Q7U70_05765 [Methylotenera sp.]|nr:hypothetical protein [Methylotenera sp.]
MGALALLGIVAYLAWVWFETAEVSVPGAKKPEPVYVWAYDYDYDLIDGEYKFIWSYKQVGTHGKCPSRIF